MPHEHLLNRIRAEYLEMPGLRLTCTQMQRLCGIDRAICQMVLDTLVETRFLYIKADGTYARLTDGEIPYPRAAKADLRPEQRFVRAS
ncbi:MAG TPA: hypothetical protein VNZ26_10455 [Vicinamibacterales bacterium]|jgi:hypothetical protein|nr:hypothetical protein [Vicinamibacterales bacterium]